MSYSTCDTVIYVLYIKYTHTYICMFEYICRVSVCNWWNSFFFLNISTTWRTRLYSCIYYYIYIDRIKQYSRHIKHEMESYNPYKFIFYLLSSDEQHNICIALFYSIHHSAIILDIFIYWLFPATSYNILYVKYIRFLNWKQKKLFNRPAVTPLAWFAKSATIKHTHIHTHQWHSFTLLRLQQITIATMDLCRLFPTCPKILLHQRSYILYIQHKILRYVSESRNRYTLYIYDILKMDIENNLYILLQFASQWDGQYNEKAEQLGAPSVWCWKLCEK